MLITSKPRTITLEWGNGHRIFGKFSMDASQYGEYLARTGKNKRNGRRRKHLMKQK